MDMLAAEPVKYEHAYTSMFLRLPAESAFRAELWKVAIEVVKIELTDWPDGRKSVYLEGRRIRKDGVLSSRRRGLRFSCPDQLPTQVGLIVESARPGWWTC